MNRVTFCGRYAALDRLDFNFGYFNGTWIAADFRWFHWLNAWLDDFHFQFARFGFQQLAGLVFDAWFTDFASLFSQTNLWLVDNLLFETNFGQLAGADLELRPFNSGALRNTLGFWYTDGAWIAWGINELVSVAKTYLRDFYGCWHRAVLERRIYFPFRHYDETLMELSKTIKMNEWMGEIGLSAVIFPFFQGNFDCGDKLTIH